MRAFLAIGLPPVEGVVPPELRPEDHLTLQFFEELPEDRVPDVVGAMRKAVHGVGPFAIEIRGVSAFPNRSRPRVVWAGVSEGATEVQALVDRLRQAMVSRGFPLESRPFTPHRTLARVRSPQEAAWAVRFLSEPDNIARRWTRTTVSEILLTESELTSRGARHTVRERVSLDGPRSSPAPP